MVRELVIRLARWLLALVTRDADDTRDVDTNTTDQGDGSDNTTNRSEPPSRPETPTEPERDELHRSGDADEPEYDIEWPPYIGSQAGPDWPTETPEPIDTIEVRLYWHESSPAGERACRQCVPYVLYCLLDAWGDRYHVTVDVHPEPVPGDVNTADAFSSWYWNQDEMAKDANLLLHDLGSGSGRAGGYGGWADALPYMNEWDFDPDVDSIKNVAGGDGPTRGVLLVLHELGHCLGLGHETREIRAWSASWVTPMADGDTVLNAPRYAFEYHPDVKQVEPKVQ